MRTMCPNLTCRKTLTVPDSCAGKTVRCRGCGTTFRVPKAQAPEKPDMMSHRAATARRKVGKIGPVVTNAHCCEEAWAAWHPTQERPLVALDSKRGLRAWGVFRSAPEALSAALGATVAGKVVRVLIVDPRFYRVVPKRPKPPPRAGKRKGRAK